MKLVAFIQMYNEVQKGNLVRCLENVKKWADDIVIYDDASTDNSVEVASRYTNHIVRGEVNNHADEVFHKQILIDYVHKNLKPDWIMWIDCDEIVDSEGTNGGLRKLCEATDVSSYSFHEINLWRSETWQRVDSLFNCGWYTRLWKYSPDLKFLLGRGLHMALHPQFAASPVRSSIEVIHYGFSSYKPMLKKIGAHVWTKEDFMSKAAGNWILNETTCDCVLVPKDKYPVENSPKGYWIKPRIRAISELIPYSEIVEEFSHEEVMGWWNSPKAYFTAFDFSSFSNPGVVQRISLTKTSNILELGYGYGRELFQFCKISDCVYGLDIRVDDMVLATQKLTEQGVTKLPVLGVYDGHNFDLGIKFDLIYSCFVIQHMSKRNALELIINSLRNLASSGHILFEFFGDPIYTGLCEEDKFSGPPHEGGMYNNGFNQDTLTLLIAEVRRHTPVNFHWVEYQTVNTGGVNFSNLWLCLSRP